MSYWIRIVVLVVTRLLAGIAIYAFCTPLSYSDQSVACRGIWAASGSIPYVASSGKQASVLSPNGTDAITPTDSGLAYTGAFGATVLAGVIGNPPLTEILWAKDSKDFVINESEGGLVGSWRTHYFSVKSEKPIEHPMDMLLHRLSVIGPDCDGEMMNYGIAGWIGANEKSFLLIQEVPPHSSCQHMGAIVGAKVSVADWKITEILSEKEIKAQWPDLLGCRHNGPEVQDSQHGK